MKLKAHQIAEQLASENKGRSLNEADTRHQVIDRILHEILGWPRNRVSCEEYIAPGFADYVLKRSNDEALLFIEAKREGIYFNLPKAITGKSRGSYITVKTLLTDDAIKAAVQQVRTYCLEIGCDVGAITNGHEWIFFKTFQRKKDWKELKAFVIAGIEYFSDSFVEAHNNFEYTAITDRGSLRQLLLDDAVFHRELFYPKQSISSFDAPVDANRYAASLRPIADRYFGVINADDADFMDRCYVSDRDYDASFKNARKRLEDAVTPYLEQYNVQEFSDTEGGGKFGHRLAKGITTAHASDVVVLFGGKGVGKSTFLKKLLFHKPPQILKTNAAVVMVDLLPVPPDQVVIRSHIWNEIVSGIDRSNVLQGNRDSLCALFSDRFEKANRQDLFGLNSNSSEYNVSLNNLVSNWKNDTVYVAERLANELRRGNKAPIIVIDNTDQYSEDLQEICFSIAQEISQKLACLVVISMREERFYASSIHGVLDAYQNSGFHISAPSPKEVFLKRTAYVLMLLTSDRPEVVSALPSRVDIETGSNLFRIFEREFRSRQSHLSNFLTACSHGNIRLALELFRGFVVSGYTNVGEMAQIGRWKIQMHQVLKPFMIPNRFFYSEQLSRIPNVFQIRSKAHGSHFTALRILLELHKGHDRKAPTFKPVAQLKAEFVETFGMAEDFDLNADMLLKYGLIEANNRLDIFDARVDSIKLTPYGEFVLNDLSLAFTYLELVCVDCAISDYEKSNSIAQLSIDEYRMHVERKRLARVELRVRKTDAFIQYLEQEEAREIELFNTHDQATITSRLRTVFNTERERILNSAQKNS